MKFKRSYRTDLTHALLAALFLAALLIMPAQASAKFNNKIENRPYADQKRWHLGFSIGTSLQDLKFTHNGYITPEGQQWFTEVPSWSPGIDVTVLADLRLHQHFNLRFSPGMAFGTKGAEMIDYTTGETHKQTIKSVYVLLPLDLKISGMRWQNARPYVTVGAMGAFDVSKKRTEYLQFKNTDAYLTVGMGCDFYLPFFKLCPEIKFCFGLTDILKHDRPDLEDDPEMFKITQSLTKVKSNMVMITFYFE